MKIVQFGLKSILFNIFFKEEPSQYLPDWLKIFFYKKVGLVGACTSGKYVIICYTIFPFLFRIFWNVSAYGSYILWLTFIVPLINLFIELSHAIKIS